MMLELEREFRRNKAEKRDLFRAVVPSVSAIRVSPFLSLHLERDQDMTYSFLRMYERTGNEVYLKQAKDWINYDLEVGAMDQQKNPVSPTLREDLNYGFDHAYGWGLVKYYEITKCAPALETALNLADLVERFLLEEKFTHSPFRGWASYYNSTTPSNTVESINFRWAQNNSSRFYIKKVIG